MKIEKIIVDFIRVENVLIAKLVEFPKDLCGSSIIIVGGDYALASIAYTAVSRHTLYLSGVSERKEAFAAYAYEDEIEAKKALENFKLLIREYNSRCEKADTTMKEDLLIKWERAE